MRLAAAMNACGGGGPAAQREGDQRAETAVELPSGQIVVGMVRQAGIMDHLDRCRAGRQKPGDLQGIGRGALGAKRQRLQPTRREPTIERRGRPTPGRQAPAEPAARRRSPPANRPSRTSLCPFIDLVKLSTTRSAPSSNGRQMAGPASELSTNSSASCSWASSARAARLATRKQRIGDRFDHDQPRAGR